MNVKYKETTRGGLAVNIIECQVVGPEQPVRTSQRCHGLPCLHGGKSPEPPLDRHESP